MRTYPRSFFYCARTICSETRRSLVLAGITHAAAMLFHQLAFLFLPIALLRLKEPKQRLSYAACSLGLAGIAYILAYRVVCGQFPRRRAWPAGLMAHSPDASFSWQPVRDLWLTLEGTLRLFFGGRLNHAAAEPSPIIGRCSRGCLHGGIGGGLEARRPASVPRATKGPVLWVGVYAAFLFVWMPQNTF